jgi:hypothetical protein
MEKHVLLFEKSIEKLGIHSMAVKRDSMLNIFVKKRNYWNNW